MKCLKCKDDYKPKSNTIKMGKYWCEVYDLDNNGWNLCGWCEFSLNQEVINDSL